MRIRTTLLILTLLLQLDLVRPVRADAGIRVLDDRVSLNFPQTATFSAEFQSSVSIRSVVLEYGVDQQTCGHVIAEAFPDFSPSPDVKVSWTWDMRQSGSLPPGARLWWDWRVQDDSGSPFSSLKQTATWLDSAHPWQSVSGGDINLHWYDGGSSFAQQLHDYAAQALTRLTHDIGVGTDQPVDVYIYANTQDLQQAVLYTPSWTGGLAFPENDIVIIGIEPTELDWGEHAEAHELTHVLVGHETFSCLGFIPTWLNEGLAVYGQGGPDPAMQATFNAALAGNSLDAVRDLNGSFPESSNQADLAYGESYSIVDFLIGQYGRDRMTSLLLALRDGSTPDQALQAVYGFDVDGLDSAWRAAIHAPSRSGASKPTPIPTPTIVPTIVPIQGKAPAVPPAGQVPSQVPSTVTASPAAQPAVNLHNPDLFTTLVAVWCLLVVLVLALLIIVLATRSPKKEK